MSSTNSDDVTVINAVALQDILNCLYKQQDEQERAKRLDSKRELYSMIAAITIFIATLSATLLAYFQSVFDSRARNTGLAEKRTDSIINCFALFSILLSIGATVCLAYGLTESISLRVPNSSTENPATQSTPSYGLTESISLRAPNSSAEIPATQPTHFPPAPVITHQPQRYETLSELEEAKGLHRSQGMLKLALIPMLFSLTFLLAALLVFLWAEQKFGVALSLTLELVAAYGAMLTFGIRECRKKVKDI